MWFSVWNDLLSTSKITIFLAKSLPKHHKPMSSNAVTQPLYENKFTFEWFLVNLTLQNKQFLM